MVSDLQKTLTEARHTRFGCVLIALAFAIFGCAEEPEDKDTSNQSSSNRRYLYVASGTCYAGQGNTAFTQLSSSNLVYRINLDTGLRDRIIADYNAAPAQPGDSPTGLAVSANGQQIYIAVDNATAGARRIEAMGNTANAARSLVTGNATTLSAALRNLALLSNGDLLISKSTAIERITSSGVRLTKGSNPYVNAPAAPCATSTTLMSKIGTLSNGMIYFSHAAASQNRFAFVKSSGYSVAADCGSAQSSPALTAAPSAIAIDTVNSNMIVAFAGSTTDPNINSIYVYPLTLTASSVTVGTGVKIYDSAEFPTTHSFLLFGVTDMQLDLSTNKLYVATANSATSTVANFQIEALNYAPSQIGVNNANVLTRSNGAPFYGYGSDTKCISQMAIAN